MSIHFIAKLTPLGSALVYSTYLGGTSPDMAQGVAVDRMGNIYVSGNTGSRRFPVTSDGFDKTFNGGTTDAFIVKLNVGGSALAYSTYLGGTGVDSGHGISLLPDGSALMTGLTGSVSFPTAAGAYDTTYNGGSRDAFVTKFAQV